MHLSKERRAELLHKLADAEGRLGRLYAAIESGIADSSDPTLKERVAAVKTERDIAQVAFDRTVAEMRPSARITEEKIAAFVEAMRANVTGYKQSPLGTHSFEGVDPQ